MEGEFTVNFQNRVTDGGNVRFKGVYQDIGEGREQTSCERSAVARRGIGICNFEVLWVCAAVFLGLAAVAAPYAIIGGMTHFLPRYSAKSERVWTMLWMVFGHFSGWGIVLCGEVLPMLGFNV